MSASELQPQSSRPRETILLTERLDLEWRKTGGHPRSPRWPEVRLGHLAEHPGCAACGRTDSVQVHHILPLAACMALGRLELELDPRNLITLCESAGGILTDDHHLYLGHLGGFHLFNPEVRADAAGRYRLVRKKDLVHDKAIHQKLQAIQDRFPSFGMLGEVQKAELRGLVERLLEGGNGR